MARRLYLGLEQAAGRIAALLLDGTWRPVGYGTAAVFAGRSEAGWMECAPQEILGGVESAVQKALRSAGAQPSEICCAGLSYESGSAAVWDRDRGQMAGSAIAGSNRSPAPWAEKLRWLLDREDPQRTRTSSGQLAVGPIGAWLTSCLTGGSFCYMDCSAAAETALYRSGTGNWDTAVLRQMGLAESALPAAGDSAGMWEYIVPEVLSGIHCPLTGVLSARQASLLGQACAAPGMAACTGDGALLMSAGDTPESLPEGLTASVAWQLSGQRTYALSGSPCGFEAGVRWLRDGLGVVDDASGAVQIAQQTNNSGGVLFVPPRQDWSGGLKQGMMIGITGGTSREQMIRAAVESPAYQVWERLDALRRSGLPEPAILRWDGVVCAPFFLQLQADLLGIPVEVSETGRSAALGAAYMAAIGAGALDSPQETAPLYQLRRRYEPQIDAQQRKTQLRRWQRAVERVENWME